MSTYFKNGGKININQLQHLGNSIIEMNDKNRNLIYTAGVLKLPDEVISRNFKIEPADNEHINVGYISSDSAAAPFGGVAVDKNGKVISITSNQAYVGSIDDTTDIGTNIEVATTFNINDSVWTPGRTDDPNLQDFGPISDCGYKRNSGNYNIPIVPGYFNYVYIKYIEIVKQNADSTQEANGVNYETEFTDGYCITVTRNNPVESPLDDTWILIGQVDATTINTLPICDNSIMQLGYLNGSTVGSPFFAQTGWSNYPTQSGEYIDLETHINAVGTGIPTSTNPHGISAADIGANVNNAGFNSVDTEAALPNGTYTLGSPLLDLSGEGSQPQSYDIVLIDASEAPQNSEVVVRLPEANIYTTAYKYTFKNTGVSTGTVVKITSKETNTGSNLIDGGTSIGLDDATFSCLTLANSSSVTLVVGLVQGDYNWWRI